VQLQVVQVVPISSGGITIKEIFKGAIGHYFFNGDKIIINDDGYIARGKGWVGKINDITYLSDSSAIVTNDVGALKSISPIQILDFNTRYMQTRQIGNMIFALDGNTLFQLDMEKIYGGSILTSRSTVNGKSFQFGFGICQVFSNSSILQINYNGQIAAITTRIPVVDFIQSDKYLSIKYRDTSKSYKFGYVCIDEPNRIIRATDNFKAIAIKGDFVFEAGDGIINVLRKHDFEKISEIECNVVSEQSALHYNQAGIIVVNADGSYIVNMNK